MPKRDQWSPDSDPIDDEEAQRIFRACDGLTIHASINWRWKLHFQVLWYTGLRVAETLGLTPADVADGEITFYPVKTKHQVPLIQPVPRHLTTELKAYCATYKVPQRKAIFDVTGQRVGQVLRQAAARAGIHRHVHPHLFRHGYGRTMAIELEGFSQERQRAMLRRLMHHRGTGSSSSRVLGRYLQPTARDLQDVVRRAFDENRSS